MGLVGNGQGCLWLIVVVLVGKRGNKRVFE